VLPEGSVADKVAAVDAKATTPGDAPPLPETKVPKLVDEKIEAKDQAPPKLDEVPKETAPVAEKPTAAETKAPEPDKLDDIQKQITDLGKSLRPTDAAQTQKLDLLSSRLSSLDATVQQVKSETEAIKADREAELKARHDANERAQMRAKLTASAMADFAAEEAARIKKLKAHPGGHPNFIIDHKAEEDAVEAEMKKLDPETNQDVGVGDAAPPPTSDETAINDQVAADAELAAADKDN
jgi:outer membrane murein-binding lipoprotein Lpp